MNKSKLNHLKSVTHKTISESILRGHIIQNPKINDFDEIKRKNNNIYDKKYER